MIVASIAPNLVIMPITFLICVILKDITHRESELLEFQEKYKVYGLRKYKLVKTSCLKKLNKEELRNYSFISSTYLAIRKSASILLS